MRAAWLALAISLLVVPGCGAPEETPARKGGDVLVVNARSYTLRRVDGGRLESALGATPGALLVRDGQVVAVGDEASLSEQAEGDVTRVDAGGGLVVAGLHDAHTHVLGGALGSREADLEPASTVDEALEIVRRWAEAHPEAPWVLGRGWSYDLTPKGEFPTRHMLDLVVPERPVLLEAYDGHSSWVNTKALELAGVTAETPDPADGKIVREADGKTPQGALLESASALVSEHVPALDRATKLAALGEALIGYRDLGVTTVHAICSSTDELSLYEALLNDGELPIRVVVGLPLDMPIDEVVAVRDRLATGQPEWLRLGFLKGFLDGVIESRTAFMLEPYTGTTDERGAPNYTREQLQALVNGAHAHGIPVALHAIGDAAVRMALDVYEAAQKAHPDVELVGHHRIEHIEVVHPDDLPRFRALGVVASMQPYHAVPSDAPSPDDVWSANLGPERLTRAFAWRALLDAGATLAFGSDWPVFTRDPLKGMAVAVTRRNVRGLPAEGWQAHQAITFGEALWAYTIGPVSSVWYGDPLAARGVDLTVLEGVRPGHPETLWTGRARTLLLDGRPVPEPSR